MEMLRLDERNPSFAHEEELAAEFTDEENAAHDDAATDDLASSTCSTSSQSSSEGEGSTESAPTPTCDGPAAACSPVALPASPTETCTSNEEAARKLHVVDATGEDTRIDAGGLLFKGNHVAFVHPRMEARFSASLYRDALPLHMAILCTILALRLRWMLDVALSADAVRTHWAHWTHERHPLPPRARSHTARTSLYLRRCVLSRCTCCAVCTGVHLAAPAPRAGPSQLQQRRLPPRTYAGDPTLD
jgi:hypothetical protein